MSDSGHLFEGVRRIFERVAASYECAQFSVAETHPCGGPLLELRCSEPDTLSASACVIQDQVDVYLSSGTLEMVKRRKDPDDVILRNVEPVIRAAAEGRIEQIVRGPVDNPVWTRRSYDSKTARPEQRRADTFWRFSGPDGAGASAMRHIDSFRSST